MKESIQEALVDKFEEVKDLASRGMLTTLYIMAWEDVMKIVKQYPIKKPIAQEADEVQATVRIARSTGPYWVGSVRFKGPRETELIGGSTYIECEEKARAILMLCKEDK